jgi:hypothetical protein
MTIAHTVKTVARILRSTKRKAEDVLGGQFGYRMEGNYRRIEMQKIILEGHFRHR